MLGWKAVSWRDPELAFEHLRPMGSSQQNILVGRRRHGFGQYYMGSDPLYFIATADPENGPSALCAGWVWRPPPPPPPPTLQGYFGAMLRPRATAWGCRAAPLRPGLSAPGPAQGQIPHRGADRGRARPAVEPGRVILPGPNRAEFIVIGAMKAATSTICSYLEDHPDTYMVPRAEPNYFSRDENFARGDAWYDAHFAPRTTRNALR